VAFFHDDRGGNYWGRLAAAKARLGKVSEVVRRAIRHPSLHFNRLGQFWSGRVGLHHRAVAVESGDDRVWFWIGSHADYDRLLSQAG